MENKKSFAQSVWELLRFTLLALAIVIPIRLFIVQPFIVSGSSMYPTFENGDYLIIDEVSYRLGEPKRNEVVVFRYPQNPKKFFIKRIIGLPNEAVSIKEGQVTIYSEARPEGQRLDEPYVKNGSITNLEIKLDRNEYFVMGDNRSASSDSRYWGPVPEKLLVGKALVRLWPIGKITIYPGDID
jgi:signal peptidase I